MRELSAAGAGERSPLSRTFQKWNLITRGDGSLVNGSSETLLPSFFVPVIAEDG